MPAALLGQLRVRRSYAVTRAWRRIPTPRAITASAAATAIQSGKPVKGRLPCPTAWMAPRTPPCGPWPWPLPADEVAPRTLPVCVLPVAEAPVELVPVALPVAVTDVELDVDTDVFDVMLVLDVLLVLLVFDVLPVLEVLPLVLLEPPDCCVQAADE